MPLQYRSAMHRLLSAAHGPINRQVAQRLQRIREAKRMPRSDAARRAGMPYTTYYALERCSLALKADSLYRMLFALEINIEEVWPNQHEEPQHQRSMAQWTG